MLPEDNQAVDFSEVSEDQDTVSGDITEVQAGSSRMGPKANVVRIKLQFLWPVCVEVLAPISMTVSRCLQ